MGSDLLVANGRWHEILGLDVDVGESYSRASWLALVHPDDVSLLETGLQALLVGSLGSNSIHEIELRVRHKSGHWIWVLHRSQVVEGSVEAAALVYGTLLDITIVRQQTVLLAGSRRFLDRAKTASVVGGWQYDLLARRVSWSKETCRIHGRAPGYEPTPEEAIGYFAKPAVQLFRRSVKHAIVSGDGFDIELPLLRTDGKRILVRVTGVVEFNAGKPAVISGAVRDITDSAAIKVAELQHGNVQLERANERLSIATRSSGIGIWDFKLSTGEYLWDEQMFEIYGLDSSKGPKIDPRIWLGALNEQDQQIVLDSSRAAILGHGPDDLEFRITRGDGSERDIYGTAHVVRDSKGFAIRLVGTNQDVTESRQLTRDLASQHKLLQVTLQSIGDGVITADTFGNVIWMNPVAEEMVGWNTSEASGRPLNDVFQIVCEGTRELAPNPVLSCLKEDRVVGLSEDTVLISATGDERWIEQSAAPIRCDNAEIYGAVLIFHDVTDQRKLATEMTWRATHDSLTGLLNRSEFEANLRQLFEELDEGDCSHALLYIDLDQFKIVNDSCGHGAGDDLLRQVGQLLRQIVRGDDKLVRLGGDEFAIIIENCSTDTAMLVAREICSRMDEYRFVYESHRFRIGVSIGLVQIDNTWDDVSAIIRAADAACYAAKDAGRNRVHLWCDTDHGLQQRRIETRWATRLETALDNAGFELFAQRVEALSSATPAHDLLSAVNDTSSVQRKGHHAEVLLRMKGEGDALILPGAFLPAAERYNLIYRVDQWVLMQVVAWLELHSENMNLDRLWINLSGQSVGDKRFQAETLTQLQTAGPAICHSLCFEITETAAVVNISDTIMFINALKKLNVKVALDDFGAGASSFGYLKTLPVDYLKIDGQFVRNLTTDPLDKAAVRSFIEVAQVMGIKTVAEFVETPDVLAQLRIMGVDYAQGWLLHKPAPLVDLVHVHTSESVVCPD
ncbi:MAG: EAL domain-containing protein [Granulosicoccus sp.]